MEAAPASAITAGRPEAGREGFRATTHPLPVQIVDAEAPPAGIPGAILLPRVTFSA